MIAEFVDERNFAVPDTTKSPWKIRGYRDIKSWCDILLDRSYGDVWIDRVK